MTDVLELTKELIKCRSVTPNNDGSMQIIGDFLEDLGFDVEIFESSDPSGWNVNNLWASYSKGDGPDIAFVGHVDVVPVGDILNWITPPFKANVVDGKLYGRGASDMKSAIAAFCFAVKNFIASNDFNGKISFLLTSDEEEGSPQGMRSIINWCIKNGKMPDYCIIGEPTSNENVGDFVNIGRRGSINFKVISKGVQGHVAYPHFAENAINPIISFLNTVLSKKWNTGDDVYGDTCLEITSISVDNDVTNVIPGKAEANFNVRFNSSYTAESLTSLFKDMASLVSSNLEVQSFASGDPFITDCQKLMDDIKGAIFDVTKIDTTFTTNGATSDGRFLIKYCPVIEFGVSYKSIHKENEFVKVEEIEILTKVYERFLERFFLEV